MFLYTTNVTITIDPCHALNVTITVDDTINITIAIEPCYKCHNYCCPYCKWHNCFWPYHNYHKRYWIIPRILCSIKKLLCWFFGDKIDERVIFRQFLKTLSVKRGQPHLTIVIKFEISKTLMRLVRGLRKVNLEAQSNIKMVKRGIAIYITKAHYFYTKQKK